MDLLLGNFATDFVMDMDELELAEYERILSEETIDIYNYVTGKDPVPEACFVSASCKGFHFICSTTSRAKTPCLRQFRWLAGVGWCCFWGAPSIL